MTVARRAQIAPFHVMRVVDAVAARRAAGLPVLDLSAGQPSTAAPAAVRAAASAALESHRIGYTGPLGLPALRAAIAAHYERWHGLDVDPANVAVTTGSSGAFLVSFLAAFDVGDVVAVAQPGYPAYRNVLAALGCEVVGLRSDAASRFQPTAAALEALPEPPAGLVVASPANPTGTMLDGPSLAALVAWCAEHGTRLVSDEIYHGITFDEPATTAWATSRDPLVASSFSKYFSMTGWRIGWLLVPDGLREVVDRLAANFTVCPPTLSQLAAIAAFDAYDELDANVARYRDNRDLLLAGLRSVGVDQVVRPEGAFYVYVDVSRWTNDSLTWADRVLDETGVAMAPGIDFDPVDGGRFVRMCFAGEASDLVRAVDVLGEWLGRQPVL
jgi:aspartate/methionine/tyrosine aminotransferase